jgi:hypothetical protein
MRFVATLWAAAAAAVHSSLDDRPHLRLGSTVLVGKYLQASNLDFFGGYNCLIIARSPPHFSILGIPFAEPPVGRYRLAPPHPKYSLSPLQLFDASNYGLPCLQPVGHPPLSTL